MIPRPIYEALPYFCMGVGVAAVLGLDPTGGRLAGLVLLGVGYHVFRLRKAYRKGQTP